MNTEEKELFVPTHCVIPGHLITNKNIESSAIRLYALIAGLAKGEAGCCFASNQKLGSALDIDLRTIQRWLDSLEAEGYIERRIYQSQSSFIKKRFIYLSEKFKNSLPNDKIVTPDISNNSYDMTKMPPPHDKNVIYNRDNYKKDKKESILTDAKEKGVDTPRPPPSPQKKIKSLEKEEKKEVGRFGNVRLKEKELVNLVEEHGKEKIEDYIQRLDFWLGEGHGKDHKNHYMTILKWIDKDLKNPPLPKTSYSFHKIDRTHRKPDGSPVNPEYLDRF